MSLYKFILSFFLIKPRVGTILYSNKNKSHCVVVEIDDFLGRWEAQWVNGPLICEYFSHPFNKTWKKDWKIARAFSTKY